MWNLYLIPLLMLLQTILCIAAEEGVPLGLGEVDEGIDEDGEVGGGWIIELDSLDDDGRAEDSADEGGDSGRRRRLYSSTQLREELGMAKHMARGSDREEVLHARERLMEIAEVADNEVQIDGVYDDEDSVGIMRGEALYELGELHLRGLIGVVKRDFRTALRDFKDASAQGNAAARHLLAFAMSAGAPLFGEEVDEEKAAVLEEAAALEHFSNATLALAARWLYGHGVERDCERALMLYKEAAESAIHHHGDEDTFFHFGEWTTLREGDIFHERSRQAWEEHRRHDEQLLQHYREHSSDRHQPPDATAKYEMGRILELGFVDQEKNSTQAAYFFNQAAALRHPGAMTYLGYKYLMGIGVPQHIDKGVDLLEMAHALGSPRASAILCQLKFDGGVIDVDVDQARDYCRAGQNDPLALYLTGYDLFRAGHMGEARQYFTDALKHGFIVDAAHRLALMYEGEQGVWRSCKDAVKYYKMIAEAGAVAEEVIAANRVFFSAADSEGALIRLARMADEGVVVAQANAAWMFNRRRGFKGAGGTKHALHLYTKAAQQGCVQAEAELGRIFFEGRGGVQVDYEEAARHLQKAAHHPLTPNKEAMYRIARMYEEGRGVPQDLYLGNQLYKHLWAIAPEGETGFLKVLWKRASLTTTIARVEVRFWVARRLRDVRRTLPQLPSLLHVLPSRIFENKSQKAKDGDAREGEQAEARKMIGGGEDNEEAGREGGGDGEEEHEDSLDEAWSGGGGGGGGLVVTTPKGDFVKGVYERPYASNVFYLMVTCEDESGEADRFCYDSDGTINGECDCYDLWTKFGTLGKESFVSVMGSKCLARRTESRHHEGSAWVSGGGSDDDDACGDGSSTSGLAWCLQEGPRASDEEGHGGDRALVVAPCSEEARGWELEGGHLVKGGNCAQLAQHIGRSTGGVGGYENYYHYHQHHHRLVSQPSAAGCAKVELYDMGPFVLESRERELCFDGTDMVPCKDRRDPRLQWGLQLMSQKEGGQYSLFSAYPQQGKQLCLSARVVANSDDSRSSADDDGDGSATGSGGGGDNGGDNRALTTAAASSTVVLSMRECDKRRTRKFSLAGERLSVGVMIGGRRERWCLTLQPDKAEQHQAGALIEVDRVDIGEGRDKEEESRVRVVLTPCHLGFEPIFINFP